MDEDKKQIIFESEDRDEIIRKLIEQDRIDHAESHLGDTQRIPAEPKIHSRGYNYYSEVYPYQADDGISLVIAPAWGIIFPPYNIARLTGLLRHYGYRVNVHDINIETYHYVKNNHDKDFWESRYYFVWERPVFHEEVFPVIKPVLDNAIERILNDKNDIVGFSLYLTNLLASMYMITEIKKRRPDIKIVVGGPEAFNDWFETLIYDDMRFTRGIIDYRITGEGEQELLTLLENYKSFPQSNEMITFGGFRSKLDLNQLPFPDYSDYDLNLYQHPEGASIETSRGCVAKCSFCAETWFWKYRFRTSDRVIEEMKHQIEKYGTRRFWFVDSLANGAFTEFKNLVHQMVEQKLNVRWNSYARCDGRMDLELFKKIAESGCMSLSFGVESGSEKVLTDMKKKVAVWEIENNLRDGAAVGMKNHVNWVVGFPTEGPGEFLHSLHVLYNTRKWMYAISPGMTCGDAPFSDLNVNWQEYDLNWIEKPWDNTFMSNWYTKGYVNTIVHRFIRLKFMQIWLDLAVNVSDGTVNNAQYRPGLRKFYDFKPLTDEPIVDYISQQKNQKFNYFKSDESDQLQFSASLANEYLPYAWALYKVYGPFEIKIRHDRDEDLAEFGGFIVSPYWGDVYMRVDEDEQLTFRAAHRFKHETTREDPRVIHEEIPRQDMSFEEQVYELSCNINDFNGDDSESKGHTS
jgi:anaerobic magnesium-protoporphyrin IX monomethyl ester cyclase